MKVQRKLERRVIPSGDESDEELADLATAGSSPSVLETGDAAEILSSEDEDGLGQELDGEEDIDGMPDLNDG